MTSFFEAIALGPSLQRKFDLCTPRKETARPQSHFPHSCIYEQSHNRSTYFLAEQEAAQ
jgi:hypothetical protein